MFKKNLIALIVLVGFTGLSQAYNVSMYADDDSTLKIGTFSNENLRGAGQVDGVDGSNKKSALQYFAAFKGYMPLSKNAPLENLQIGAHEANIVAFRSKDLDGGSYNRLRPFKPSAVIYTCVVKGNTSITFDKNGKCRTNEGFDGTAEYVPVNLTQETKAQRQADKEAAKAERKDAKAAAKRETAAAAA